MHSAIHQSWSTSISDASFYLLTPGAHHNRPIVTYFRISIKLFNPLNVLQPHTPQLTAYSPTPPSLQPHTPHPPAYSHTTPSCFTRTLRVLVLSFRSNRAYGTGPAQSPWPRAPQPPKPALLPSLLVMEFFT